MHHWVESIKRTIRVILIVLWLEAFCTRCCFLAETSFCLSFGARHPYTGPRNWVWIASSVCQSPRRLYEADGKNAGSDRSTRATVRRRLIAVSDDRHTPTGLRQRLRRGGGSCERRMVTNWSSMGSTSPVDGKRNLPPRLPRFCQSLDLLESSWSSTYLQ